MAEPALIRSYDTTVQDCHVCGAPGVEHYVANRGQLHVDSDGWLIPHFSLRGGLPSEFQVRLFPRVCPSCFYTLTGTRDPDYLTTDGRAQLERRRPARVRLACEPFSHLTHGTLIKHPAMRALQHTDAYAALSPAEVTELHAYLLSMLHRRAVDGEGSRATLDVVTRFFRHAFAAPRSAAVARGLFALERDTLALLFTTANPACPPPAHDATGEVVVDHILTYARSWAQRERLAKEYFLYRIGDSFLHERAVTEDPEVREALLAHALQCLTLSEQVERHEVDREAFFQDEHVTRELVSSESNIRSPIKHGPYQLYYRIVKAQLALGQQTDERLVRKLRQGIRDGAFPPAFETEKLEPLLWQVQRQRPDVMEATEPPAEGATEPASRARPGRIVRRFDTTVAEQLFQAGCRLSLQPEESGLTDHFDVVLCGWQVGEFLLTSLTDDPMFWSYLKPGGLWHVRLIKDRQAFGFRARVQNVVYGESELIRFEFPEVVEELPHRHSERIRTLLMCDLVWQTTGVMRSDAPQTGLVLDLSMEGCRIATQLECTPGDHYQVTLVLPDGSHVDRLLCEVRNIRIEEGRTVVGMRFADEHSDAYESIQRFFQRELIQGLLPMAY